MSIKAKIMNTLKPLGVPVQFLSREDDGNFPFIVFNVTETPTDFADDDDNGILYLVAINIYSKADYNFEKLKLDIVKAMKENGFKKNQIPSTEWLEKEQIYNQPMAFIYYEPIDD